MLVLAIILSFFSLGALLCSLSTVAIYALPFFVAVTAGMAAFHSGAGVIGAILVGALAGGATLAIGQILFATVRSPAIRATVALLYAIPATIAGYSATHGLRPRRDFCPGPVGAERAFFGESLPIGTLSGHF